MPYYGTLKTSGNIDLAGSGKRIRSSRYRTLCWALVIGLMMATVIGLSIILINFAGYGTSRSPGVTGGLDGTGQTLENNNFREDYYPGLLGQLRLVGGIRHADGM